MTETPPIGPQTSRLLIVAPSWVGDTVMSTPVFRAARHALPQAHITVIVRPGVEPLLAGFPAIDTVTPCDFRGVFGPGRGAREIKRATSDALLLMPNSFRSAWTARRGRAPIRVGYDRDGRGRLLTHRCPVEKREEPTPTIGYYACLGCFAFGLDQIDQTMSLTVTVEEDRAADQLLEGIDGPFVLLNPGANNPAKRWPAEAFAAVADELADKRGIPAVVTGSPDETDVLRAVVSAARSNIINLAERGVNLGSLKAVTQRASLMISNDTGPRHIAAALGTPMVSLFGPTDARWTTLPDVKECVLKAEPFLPSDQVADQHPELCAIDRITPPDVLAAARSLLDDQPG